MLFSRLASVWTGALLASMAASAQTATFTATGWLHGLLSPGFTCTNAQGQGSLRANVHPICLQASDPSVTGQVFIMSGGTFGHSGRT